MCKIYETLYSCNHRSKRPNPCVKTLCERETPCTAFVVAITNPLLCRLCLQIYGYQGPIILEGQTTPITTPDLPTLPFPHSFTSSRDFSLQKVLNRRPALIIGLKNGIRHPDNEYIASHQEFGTGRIQIRVVQGRYWRHTVSLEDIKWEELLPFVKRSVVLRNSTSQSFRAFNPHNASKILRGILGAALICSEIFPPTEVPVIESFSMTSSSDLEKSFAQAAAQICEQFEPHRVKLLDEADRVLDQLRTWARREVEPLGTLNAPITLD